MTEQETEGVSQITVITEHPIPLTEDRARALQLENPMFEENDRLLHADELHERHEHVLAENNEWRVFRSSIFGHEGYVFIWNYQFGHGIRFEDSEGSFRCFVEAMMRAAEEVA